MSYEKKYFIKNEEELRNIPFWVTIEFICEGCGKTCSRQYRKGDWGKLFCKQCKTKCFCQKHYGVNSPFQKDDVKNKIKNTLEKHGGYTFQREESLEKVKSTMKERYGVEHPMHSNEIKEKLYETSYERYGTKVPAQNKDVKEKIHQTVLERYNVDSTLQLPHIKERLKEAVLEKYGTTNAFYSVEGRRQKFYRFNNILFDSSWELYFYIYYKDLGHTIVREPYSIEYTLSSGKIRHYFPDFEIDGELYEIKGDQFFNEKGEPYCKITKKYWYEKYACMKMNNVNIIKNKEMIPIIHFVNDKYGIDYINQFMED